MQEGLKIVVVGEKIEEIVHCGSVSALWVVFWDQAEVLVPLERERERIEWDVSLVAKAIVGAAGAEAVERASSIVSSSSDPTVWFRCCRFDQNLPTSVMCLKSLVFVSFWVLPM